MSKYFCTKCGNKSDSFQKAKKDKLPDYLFKRTIFHSIPFLGAIFDIFLLNEGAKKFCDKCGSDTLIKLNNKIDQNE